MNNFKKSQDAVSILKFEIEILMYELAPHDWAVLSSCVDELNACLFELQEEYSKDE